MPAICWVRMAWAQKPGARMTPAILLLANLAAAQGQAVELSVPNEPQLKSVQASWDQRQIPFVRDGKHWITIIGVDLAAKPGEHPLKITRDYADGHSRSKREQVVVAKKSFPTTRLTVAPGYVDLSAKDLRRAQGESREIRTIYAKLTPRRYWKGAFRVPLPGVTGGRNFGRRRIFNGEPRAPHSGTDLHAKTGTPVHASNRGRVVLAKNLFFSGNAVFLDHGLGVYSVYLHLSKILVKPGMMVDKGQVLGLSGATGRVTGPHLHWGVRVLDARVDPFSLVKLEVN